MLRRWHGSTCVPASARRLKRRHGIGASKLVNAVLRRLDRERDALVLPAPSDPVDALALRHSHPRWLVARWVARWGAARHGIGGQLFDPVLCSLVDAPLAGGKPTIDTGVLGGILMKLVMNAVRANKPQVTQKALAFACIACWTVGMITGRLMAYLV